MRQRFDKENGSNYLLLPPFLPVDNFDIFISKADFITGVVNDFILKIELFFQEKFLRF